jgi:hypothetical protein
VNVTTGHAGVGFCSPDREQNDYYPTPPSAISALLAVERFQGRVLEPCCGDGAISRILVEAGCEVISTDLIDRGYGVGGLDFLSPAYPNPGCENIVTNPPYKLAFEFVERSLSITTGKVAMLLRLAFLETERRRKLFLSTPLARVHVFSRRITMHRAGVPRNQGKGMIAFAWFVWDHGHSGPPTLDWI